MIAVAQIISKTKSPKTTRTSGVDACEELCAKALCFRWNVGENDAQSGLDTMQRKDCICSNTKVSVLVVSVPNSYAF